MLVERNGITLKYEVLPKVILKGIGLGLGETEDEVVARVNIFADRGKKIKSVYGNRHFNNWIVRLGKDWQITNVHFIRCKICNDSGRITVYNECDQCFGEDPNCEKCNGEGNERTTIRCSDCEGAPSRR